MNKQECKKYFKKAYKKIIEQNKNLNTKNIEFEMKNIAKEQLTEYIAYSKIAVNNMKSSGNLKITLKDLLAQIDILPKIYSKENAIELANLIKGKNAYVNLINYNETKNIDFKESKKINEFYDILKKNGIDVTVRRKFGNKISAACGQLRSKEV